MVTSCSHEDPVTRSAIAAAIVKPAFEYAPDPGAGTQPGKDSCNQRGATVTGGLSRAYAPAAYTIRPPTIVNSDSSPPISATGIVM